MKPKLLTVEEAVKAHGDNIAELFRKMADLETRMKKAIDAVDSRLWDLIAEVRADDE